MSDREIVVLYQSVGKSIASSLASAGSLITVLGVGVYLDSAAMQWVGFLFWALTIFSLSRKFFMDGITTPQKAADMLRDKFGVIAAPK